MYYICIYIYISKLYYIYTHTLVNFITIYYGMLYYDYVILGYVIAYYMVFHDFILC